MNPAPVWFRRKGRKRRARGILIDKEPHTGAIKVEPLHAGWRAFWISTEEIAAGTREKQQTMKLR